MTVERIIPGSNAWEEGYATHAERYRHFLHQLKGLEILDAACGVGYGTHIIAESGAAKVTGLDVSDEALETARATFAHPHITFMKGDCTALPFQDNSFDAVTSFETIEHLKSPAEFVTEVSRVLKPGGKLFLSCPNSLTNSLSKIRPLDNPWHFSEMTFEELTGILDPNFTIDGIFHQSPSLDQITALHVEQINVAIERSLALKVENMIRKTLGRETVTPMHTEPPLAVAIKASGDPIRPLRAESDPWKRHARVFLISAQLK